MKKSLFIAAFAIISNLSFSQWTTSGNNAYFSLSDNVGIGTTTPTAKLHVFNNTGAPGITLQQGTGTVGGFGAGFFLQNLQSGANGHIYGIYANELGSLIIGNENTHVTSISVLPNASVGIGTYNTGTFKLAVEGKIGAREIQVTNTNPWPDYVFAPSYKLKPLSEVERFVKQYRHLPDVPSADDVKDGIELGKMNAILLQKIEELTLHLIELNKKVEELQKKN